MSTQYAIFRENDDYMNPFYTVREISPELASVYHKNLIFDNHYIALQAAMSAMDKMIDALNVKRSLLQSEMLTVPQPPDLKDKMLKWLESVR
jgi:hypothetical protein